MTNPERASAAPVPSTPRYDDVSIMLHWVTAVLVVLLWSIAQVIDFFPRGAPRVSARSVHISLGVLLGIILLTRIGWRVTSGVRLPRAAAGLLGWLAGSLHYLLYGLLAATILLGLANASQRGDSFFGLFAFPKLAPGNRELRDTIENLHAWAANSTLVVAGLHALTGLIHHYVLRDGVLGRMLPHRLDRRR
jgi:cytochrome b561